MSLPSLEQLTDQERARQQQRQNTLAPAIGRTLARTQQNSETGKQRAISREQFRRSVLSQIIHEAQTVADHLLSSGQQPDIKLTLQPIVKPKGMQDKFKLSKKKSSFGAWILTPPQAPAIHKSSSFNGVQNVRSGRNGFALSTSGRIYVYHTNQPLRRQAELAAAPRDAEDVLVLDRQITEETDGSFSYNDRLAPYSSGEDDLSIIHGLGIRQALAALNARAGY